MVSKQKLASIIDHTLLSPLATAVDIKRLCREAKEYGFAAVCVNPAYVRMAADELRGCEIAVCSVIGFPLGATTYLTKAVEASNAIADGATELDMVMNIGAFKSGNIDLVKKDIEGVVEVASHRALVKVIIETGFLSEDEIVEASRLVQQCGADFIKTSTGFGPRGVETRDVVLIKQTVGDSVGIKAAGGIRTYDMACELVEAGATRIGASSSVALVS